MSDNKISLSDVVNNDISLTTEQFDKNKDIIKSALILQAKRELERVLRLTDTLDKIQAKYENKVLERLDSNCNDSYLITAMNVITQCLERSQKILRDIAISDKFSVALIDASTSVTNNNIENIIGINLDTASSRDRVRNAVTAIMKSLNEETSTENNSTDINDAEEN